MIRRSAPFFSLSLSSSSYFFFFFSPRHRDHRAAKVEQTVREEDGKENRCRGGKRDQSEKERKREESLSRNELRTIFISHEWLASIRPSRAGLFSSLINTGAHPPRHGFSSGGVIRLEPRPTRIPIPPFFSAFSFATPYHCSPPSYNVRRVNWTRSHRDCSWTSWNPSRPLNPLRSRAFTNRLN